MWRQRVSSPYLSGSLPYVWHHITVNKNVLSVSLNKTFPSNYSREQKQMILFVRLRYRKTAIDGGSSPFCWSVDAQSPSITKSHKLAGSRGICWARSLRIVCLQTSACGREACVSSTVAVTLASICAGFVSVFVLFLPTCVMVWFDRKGILLRKKPL